MWRCPHCGTPQAETARCWVCRRSSTTCSTCRHFRTSLAADVGYCGNDRWRTPLTGLELRACWEEGRRLASTAEPAATGGAGRRPVSNVRGDDGPLDRPDPMRLRGFVPVEELHADDGSRGEGRRAKRQSHAKRAWVARPATTAADSVGGGIDDWERRVSLFGDPEG